MTQDEALAVLKTGMNVFLTGEPGSGKTHTVNRYISWLKEHKIEPAVTASTGIAATHIGGYTIHSWSGIGIKDELTEKDLDRLGRNNRLARRAGGTHVLIIDEISMLSAATLSLVDAACRALRNNSAPFGGMQVVLVGDFFQLPPVVRREERASEEQELFSGREDPRKRFAFSSPAWQALTPAVCYLSEQYRQDDEVFLEILSAIRRESVSETHRAALLSRRRPAAAEDTTQLHTHNINVDRVNEKKLAGLTEKPHTFTMERHGQKKLTDQLVRGCLSSKTLVLKKDARVMFTKNNFQEGFVNGTTGVVTGFAKDDSSYPIIKTTTGRHILARPMDWKIEADGKVLARIVQIPLRLAWAITVHKSQGMSLDAAHTDLRGAFEYGQGYVALSRVRTLAGLTLAGLNDHALRVHPEISAEDQVFRAASRAARNTCYEMSPDELKRREKAFVARCGGKEPPAKKIPADAKTLRANTYSLTEIRKKHKNAYKPWSGEEDKRLADWFAAGESTARIARAFGRQPGAIHARLLKLGLLQD